jgi:hypothetical protein
MQKKDHLNYSKLINDATRAIIRKVLLKVVKSGIPGDHHFYITFNTSNPDVVISANLRKKYPEHMTIVIQHQYQDLMVDTKSFSLTLSFAGKNEFIVVPFTSISYFADPSIDFVLKLEYANIDDTDFIDDDQPSYSLRDSGGEVESSTYKNNVVDLSVFRKNKKDT